MTTRGKIKSQRPVAAKGGRVSRGILPGPGNVISARGDRLVQVDVAVANLNVESTVRVGANPGFVVYRRSLTTVVG